MRTYEALYIVSPELEDSAIQTIAADVERLITTGGGTIVRSDVWGRRKLAYTIKKHTEGVYVVLRFTANPDSIKRLEQQLKLKEAIIRFLVLHMDDKTLKLEAEQQHRYEEDLRSSSARRAHQDDDDDDDDDDGFRSRRAVLNDEDFDAEIPDIENESDDGDDEEEEEED